MAARILVIEDNPASRELLTYLLGRRGHAVQVAENGARGWEQVLRTRPDLILCDLQMPELNGYEFIKKLRAHPELSGVQALTVTAFSMPGDESKALDAGFDGYLSKPIDPITFGDYVEGFLPPELRGRAPE